MNFFVARLKTLCAMHPTRAKWVVVPTHAVGRMMGDRLARDGTDWVNLRFVTPLDLALRMGAPFLVERAIDPSEEGLGPALMMRLLMALPEAPGYFRPLADQPQMAIALWSTLRELRMAGVRAANVDAVMFSSSAKHDELTALVDAYERFLASNNRGDRATVFEEALHHPDWCPVQAGDCWIEWPDTIWSPLERRLLEGLPGERVACVAASPPDVEVPRRLRRLAAVSSPAANADDPSVIASPPVPRRSSSPGTTRSGTAPNQPSLLDAIESAPALAPATHPPDAPQLVPAPAIVPAFFRAGGAEAEVEEVFRRILASGARLDDVEIACASSAYATLIWEKACRYDWPVTLATGLPATLTRPGRALLGFTEWIEDDFAAGLLRRLLESGDVRLGPRPGHEASSEIRPGRAARLLVKASAAWGRRTYRLAMTRLAKAERARITRDDIPADDRGRYLQYAEEAESLGACIDAIVALVPEPDASGEVDVLMLVRGAQSFLERHGARTSALDAAAATVLNGALTELIALGDFRCPLAHALRFIRERAEGLTVGADRARPGHLYVSSLSQAGLPHRHHLYLVGLEEGRVFPTAFEDPILLDDERATISGELAVSNDHIDEAVYAAMTRLTDVLASPEVRLCMSYSCRDVRQFRETYTSWVMLHAFRAATGNPHARYSDLHRAAGEPVSVVPQTSAAAPSLGRWWLRGVTRGDSRLAREAVFAQYPSLRAGAHAAAERVSDRFTEFDGHVPEAGPALDPAAPDVVVSPTRLEGAARCGFKYFLERGLGVRAIESGERSRDVWLDPLIRGSVLHDLYAGCLRRCRAEGRRASVARDREWLLAEARRTLAELKAEMPAPSGDVELRETTDLLADLSLFLRAEETLEAGREPVGFEVSFGTGAEAGGAGESLASVEPIEIRAGDLIFRIAGRIDRVDRIDGPQGPVFHILDYKTGGFWKDDWTGTFAGGRMLQHALYGLAVAELLKRANLQGRVAGAEYYFSATKGRQHRQHIPSPRPADVALVLSDLRNVIVSGLFVHAPADKECKFCDYQHACGRASHKMADGKIGDPALLTYRRLVGHA